MVLLNSNKRIITVILFFILLSFISCAGGSRPEIGGNRETTGLYFTVRYDSNNAESGFVLYDHNEFTPGQIVIVKGNIYNLVKGSYNFTGWNTRPDGSGVNYAQDQTFIIGSENVTLYAMWLLNPAFSVTYNRNGAFLGTVPVDATKYKSGSDVVIPGNSGNLIKTGYYFTGWNKQSVSNVTNYTENQVLTMQTEDVKLSARWSSDPVYKIIYNANGAVQSDKRILLGGSFTNYAGSDSFFTRILQTGLTDTVFSSSGTGPDGEVYCIIIQSEGKILIGGNFNLYNTTSCKYIVRLNIDGTPDTVFNSGEGADNAVKSIVIQSDGKINIGGLFTKYGGTAANHIARLL